MAIAIARSMGREVLNNIPTGTAVAATNIPANSVAYITAGGQLALSVATAGGNAAQVFVRDAVLAGAVGSYYGAGAVITGLAGLTPGANYFLSKTVAGGLSITAATGILGSGVLNQVVGNALSSTSLFFNPLGVTLL